MKIRKGYISNSSSSSFIIINYKKEKIIKLFKEFLKDIKRKELWYKLTKKSILSMFIKKANKRVDKKRSLRIKMYTTIQQFRFLCKRFLFFYNIKKRFNCTKIDKEFLCDVCEFYYDCKEYQKLKEFHKEDIFLRYKEYRKYLSQIWKSYYLSGINNYPKTNYEYEEKLFETIYKEYIKDNKRIKVIVFSDENYEIAENWIKNNLYYFNKYCKKEGII